MADRLQVWRERWDSLNTAIGDYYQWLRKLEQLQSPGGACTQTLKGLGLELPIPRIRLLGDLVSCLQAFAESQFEFFRRGFDPCDPFTLHLSEMYPVEYVLSAILEQVAYDFDVIQRAVAQRVFGSPTVKEALGKADNYAQTILTPTVGKGNLIEDTRTTAITYLHKSPNIRVIPYAPVALVGIPFTSVPFTDSISGRAITVARDYLTIPHELGHYVFWHGRLKANGKGKPEHIHAFLRRKVSKEPAWCYRWREEIFADVFGCMIGGAVMALGAQDLQLDASLEDFVKEDGSHPAPILRPHIYIKALESKSKDKTIARELRLRWMKKRGKRDKRGQFAVHNGDKIDTSDAISSGMDTTEEQATKLKHEPRCGRFCTFLAKICHGFGRKSAEYESKPGHSCDFTDKPVDRVISEALNILKDTQPGQITSLVSVRSVEELEKLYERFEDEIRKIEWAPRGSKPESESALSKDPGGKADSGPIQDLCITGMWIDRIKDQCLVDPENGHDKITELPPAIWERILFADGWLTRWPDENPRFAG